MKPSLQASIEAIQQGQPAMCLIKEALGETRGLLLLAAENATPQAVNLLAKEGRGIVCVGVTAEVAEKLDLHPMMPMSNKNSDHAVSTVSVDARLGITTGISASDRAYTLRLLASSEARADDLVRPGHIFPYVVHPQGILGRAAAAEVAVDLAHLAGLQPIGTFCGILDTHGTLAQEPYLIELATRANVPFFTLDDLMAYRLCADSFITQIGHEPLETERGTFELITYSDALHDDEHYVFQSPSTQDEVSPTVYVHHACVRGDVFGSKSCRRSSNLDAAQSQIQRDGGVIIYVGNRTPKGERGNAVAAQILRDIGTASFHLFRASPNLSTALEDAGFTVLKGASDPFTPSEAMAVHS